MRAAGRARDGQPTIVFGVTAAITARAFLVGQLHHFRDQGWQVHLVCGEGGLDDFARTEDVAAHSVQTSRAPSVRHDVVALVSLVAILVRLRPDVVVMGTPKMGLLGTVAAWLARVPRRVYLVHGYRADGARGRGRSVLRLLEKVSVACATHVVAVSPSLRDRLADDRVAHPDKVVVLGAGSANGVDLVRFEVSDPGARVEARAGLGVPADAPVVAVVARLTRDKGLAMLPRLWEELASRTPGCWLLVAGAPEPVDEADRQALAALEGASRVRMLGQIDDVETVYGASDLLLLTSLREGLGMVALEAAACGVPTVAWRATGVVDAVVDGRSGVLVPAEDVGATVRAVSSLLEDPDVRRRMGRFARQRVHADFDQRAVWTRWERFASSLMMDERAA